MNIYDGIDGLVGGTPAAELKRYGAECGAKARIIAKLEFFNPTGSVKDRTALAMIVDAEKRGLLKPRSVIVEPTSGNTGIGLAAIGAARGYRVILTMPETMSAERRKLLKAYGAEIVLTDGAAGMAGAIEKANEIAAAEGGIVLGQFTNAANPSAHYAATGPEIWEDTDGEADIFVAGVGTGGTLSGAGRFLKQKKAGIKVIAVEPFDSQTLCKGESGAHGIMGIGAGFVPDTLGVHIYDEIIAVKTADAYAAARKLAKTEGLLVGISSGAALFAATEVSRREENAGKTVVVVLPDTGERYLSTPIFDAD